METSAAEWVKAQAMYVYSPVDQAFVETRVRQFRDQTKRYLAGAISEDEFKPLRLQNGLYIERHAPMLRIAIPYGVLSSAQLRALAAIARDFDRGFGHFTTRQNIQFNWVKVEEVPDILERLAGVQMHAIQTSGSCIRNVTTDHLAGVAADEVVDPRPYAELMRQWSTLHPEFAHLPRKFKVAFNGAREDRAATAVHDLAFDLALKDGEVRLTVKAGGGQGRTPRLAAVIKRDLDWRDMLTYSEAVLRAYNRFGRRDNIYKSRIKILVEALGPDAFAAEVEADFKDLQGGPNTLTREDLAGVTAHFRNPTLDEAHTIPPSLDGGEGEAFARWRRQNVHAHKHAGFAAVSISLKGEAPAPGDASADEMDAIADLADRFSFGEIRVSHHQNLALPYVRTADLPALWRDLCALGLSEANIGLSTDIIACPGGDYCALANAKSIPVAKAVQAALRPRQHEIGDLQIKISGCINACGHHHIGHIGVLGVEKGEEEWYQILIGGRAETSPKLAALTGKAIPREAVTPAIERLIDYYLAHRQGAERFIDAVERLGVDSFKALIAEPHS